MIALTLSFLLLGFFLFLYIYSQPDVRYCYLDATAKTFPNERLPDILLAKEMPSINSSIFFLDTVCHQSPWSAFKKNKRHINTLHLTARQACALESTALHNNNSKIFMLYLCPTYYAMHSTENEPTQSFLNVLAQYKHIYFRNANIRTLSENTPVSEWIRSGSIFRTFSSYLPVHLSDFYRLLVLWRWGGTYLDTDLVLKKSIEQIPPNFAGAYSDSIVNNAVLNFHGVHNEIIENILKDYATHYYFYGYNVGPESLTRVLRNICQASNTQEMTNNASRCKGFTVFPPIAFYPVYFPEWKSLFEEQSFNDAWAKSNTPSTYLVHFWNKLSRNESIKVGTNVVYGKLAEQNCPQVYAAAGEYF